MVFPLEPEVVKWLLAFILTFLRGGEKGFSAVVVVVVVAQALFFVTFL